ncbi:MAG: hypothetical protein QOI77_2530, partial [Blastocatellia bacterium]|nr:hypothetical protein [Blastocatellia bacterium]
GPGEHPFQLNPLGRITEEFIYFAEKHPDPGIPYTPIAFLLDPAHGWDMTDYPQWPFEVSQINRSDRALRELFGAAFYPGPVREGEPASGERQAFVPGIFGNIFDVVVASLVQSPKSNVQDRPTPGSADVPSAVSATSANKSRLLSPINAIDAYHAIIVGGRIDWTKEWVDKLGSYVRNGGTLVLNSAQIKGLPNDLLGVRMIGATAEAHNAKCLSPNEPEQDLHGQIFRYDRVEARGADVLIAVPTGDPLVTVNKVERGRVVFIALPDLLGEDERLTPFVAHLLVHLASEATPVKVDGDVEYMINRTARGWVVTLFNDNGVFKPQQGMAEVDRSASVNVTISLRGSGISNANEWMSDRELTVKKQAGSDSVTLNIAAGGIAVVELRSGN